MRSLSIAIIIALTTTIVAWADDLKPQVAGLVRQLGSSELRQRTEAEDKLIALGPQILDLLPAADASATGAQKQETLARIRQRLERQQAEQAAQGATITLHVKDKPFSEVLTELTRQSGNKFKDMRQRMGQEVTDPKIGVDVDKAPFWEALDKTLDAASLSVYNFTSGDELGIVAPAENRAPRFGRASYAGPLRLEATQLAAERDLRNAGNAGSLRMTLEVAWEPRLRPILLKQPLDQLKAADDAGHSLVVAGGQGELERPVDVAGTATEFLIPLVNPPRTAKTIASFKGKLQALLPGKIEAFEFSGLKDAKKVEQQKASATVTLDESRQNDAAWEVRMRVRFDKAANALDTFRGWAFNNEAYLVGADGKPIKPSGFETTRQTEDEIGVAYEFDLPDGPDGLKFIYKTATTLNSLPLDYEFKNLPLP